MNENWKRGRKGVRRIGMAGLDVEGESDVVKMVNTPLDLGRVYRIYLEQWLTL